MAVSFAASCSGTSSNTRLSKESAAFNSCSVSASKPLANRRRVENCLDLGRRRAANALAVGMRPGLPLLLGDKPRVEPWIADRGSSPATVRLRQKFYDKPRPGKKLKHKVVLTLDDGPMLLVAGSPFSDCASPQQFQ